ncbi:MAG: hypothetical protein ACREQK_06900, partial [Candidatus Binatia bacterium]
SVLALQSRVDISPTSPLNPADPFSTPFVFHNVGYLPIYAVNFFCDLNDIQYEKNVFLRHNESTQEYTIRLIRPAEKVTAWCQFPIHITPNRMLSADITINARFRPLNLWEVREFFGFTTATDRDGNLRWNHRAVSENETSN